MTDVVEKVIRREKGKWHVYSEDGTKHLGGPYDSKAEAHKRLGQVEHFKEEDKKEKAEKAYNPNELRDKRGRWTSGGAGQKVVRAVRGKVNVANAKKVGRGAVNITKPIIKMIGKAAYAGALAGLVMGVEHTFSGAGNDVGKAAGAAAAAAANDLKRRAEEKSGVFVTARVKHNKGGGGSVSVQPAQSVSPHASSWDLSRVDVTGGGPRGTISTSPFMIHNSNLLKAEPVDKASGFSDEDVWVVVPLEDFDEDTFADAVNQEVQVVPVAKRETFIL